MANFTEVERLAHVFTGQVAAETTIAQFVEIRRRNAEPEYIDNDQCATHDFIDADMAMLEAWTFCYGTGPVMPLSGEQEKLWNDAWAFARREFLTKITP